MAKVITFSRTFPKYHLRAGEPTLFVEKFLNSVRDQGISIQDYKNKVPLSFLQSLHFGTNARKYHTIRSGNRWKAGNYFSPRVWGNDINPKTGRSGPYHSKQIEIAPDILITKVYDFEIGKYGIISLNGASPYNFLENHDKWIELIASNDGLNTDDFLDWFKYPKPFKGQIICWCNLIDY